MRLAAQAKAGYYPAHPAAIDLLAQHIRLPDPPGPGGFFRAGDLSMIDPCAGEGVALGRLASAITENDWHIAAGERQPKLYAIELHAARAEACRNNLPEGSQVLGPCSFFGCDISTRAFSLVYMNPPFDYVSGGGLREEEAFLSRAYDLLAPAGVMILIAPYGQVVGRGHMCTMLDSSYEDVEIYKFPDGVDAEGNLFRPYGEVCVIGRRRKEKLDAYQVRDNGSLHVGGFAAAYGSTMSIDRLPALGEPYPSHWGLVRANDWSNGKVTPGPPRATVSCWALPYAWNARRFAKNQLTEEEIPALVSQSQLWRLLEEPAPLELARPPLALGKGHTSLSIVSGTLDGVVPSTPPHVARGFSIKKEYKNTALCKSEVNPDTGAVTETIVYSEKPVSVVRCIEKSDEYDNVRIYEYRSDASASEADDDNDPTDEED